MTYPGRGTGRKALARHRRSDDGQASDGSRRADHLVARFAATVVVLLTLAIVVGGVVGVLITQLVDQAIAALRF